MGLGAGPDGVAGDVAPGGRLGGWGERGEGSLAGEMEGGEERQGGRGRQVAGPPVIVMLVGRVRMLRAQDKKHHGRGS